MEEEGGWNIYGMLDNDIINKWDNLGMAPDDEWDTLEETLESAADGISYRTKLSRLTGEVELMNWLLSERDSTKLVGVYNHGDNHVVYPQAGGTFSLALIGKEYGVAVFCNFKTGKFVEGSIVMGGFPVSYDGNKSAQMGHSRPGDSRTSQKKTKVAALLHTHNIATAFLNLPVDSNISSLEVGDMEPSTTDKNSKSENVKEYIVGDDGKYKEY